MSSAVEALFRAGSGSAAKRYQSMCPCCEPQQDAVPGKPVRRVVHKPTLAWRSRLLKCDEVASFENAESNKDDLCL